MSKATKNGAAVVDVEAETRTDKAREDRFVHERPYCADVVIIGTAHMLHHRYDCEQVKIQSEGGKGTKTKKTDNVESYLYRVPGTGEVGVAAVCIKAALLEAGKSFQDPRSPRKSARDLLKASVFVTPEVPSLGKKTWDFLHQAGACVQRNRITRVRPGFTEGWRLEFTINVIQPSLVPAAFLQKLVTHAGQFCGLGDWRPDYGRFRIESFKTRDTVEAR